MTAIGPRFKSLVNVFISGDLLYIPQYWWHHVLSYGTPNIAINIWFEMFNYEEQFEKSNLKEDTDVVKVSNISVAFTLVPGELSSQAGTL